MRDDGEGLRGMRPAKSAKVTMSVLMEVADAQAVVEKASASASRVLGTGEAGTGDEQFTRPCGAVWVPSHRDWHAGERGKEGKGQKGTNATQSTPVTYPTGAGGGGLADPVGHRTRRRRPGVNPAQGGLQLRGCSTRARGNERA